MWPGPMCVLVYMQVSNSQVGFLSRFLEFEGLICMRKKGKLYVSVCIYVCERMCVHVCMYMYMHTCL